jgi:hypothetical protein
MNGCSVLMHSQPTIRRCCTTRTPLCQRDACAQRACVNEVLAASKRALMATQTGRGAKEGSYRNLLRRAVCGKSCVSLTRKTSRQSLHAHETRGPTVTTIVCHTADSQGAQIGVPGQTLPPMPCPHSPPSLLCENDISAFASGYVRNGDDFGSTFLAQAAACNEGGQPCQEVEAVWQAHTTSGRSPEQHCRLDRAAQ